MRPATEPAQIKCNKTHVLSSYPTSTDSIIVRGPLQFSRLLCDFIGVKMRDRFDFRRSLGSGFPPQYFPEERLIIEPKCRIVFYSYSDVN